jgi:Ca2+-transporting ATPase
MTLIPVIFAWPLVLFPVHIAFLHLVIDPASSVAYEAEPADPDTMRQPPRDPHAPLFSRRMIGFALAQGLAVLAVVFAVYLYSLLHPSGDPVAHEAYVRALTFTTLVIANLGLIVANLSWTRSVFSVLRDRNRALWAVLVGAAVFLMVALYVPFFRDLFRFGTLGITEITVAVLAAVLSVVWFEGVKAFSGRNRPVA